MWNKLLIACARTQRSAVLTIVEPAGYPASVRCVPIYDDVREMITFPTLPPYAAGWRGKASLLLHSHNAELEEQRQLQIKGELVDEGGMVLFRPDDFVTLTSSTKTDVLPHAGTPIELFRFMLLGRRRAREYIAKRGAPWPPVRFDTLLRVLKE